MNAYVTLLMGNNYLPGVIALSRSLKRVDSKHPLIVMYRDESTDLDVLAKEDLILKKVAALPFSEPFIKNHTREAQHTKNPFTKGNKPTFHNPLDNFYKLSLWQFTEFKKIVFLDADIIVLRNIDRLFEYPEGCAAPNLYESLDDFNRMNSGVFVAEPNDETFIKMFHALDYPGAYWPRTDQTFLQSYWKNWHGLPYIYNALQYLYFNIPALWRWDNIHVIHYQYEKPWEQNNPKKEQLLELIDLWQCMYQNTPLPQSIIEKMGN